MPDEAWAQLTQKELFDMAMKHMVRSIGKTVNPSIMQALIENLEKFQLPRNVQEQEHTIGQI
jgi:HD-GYP domain-containing protein (c-di-GMP phosphodiesterase class II)